MRALLALPLLAACNGALPASFMGGGQTVEVGGDTFAYEVSGETVRLANYSTGLFNQERLYANAGLAAVQVTGCRLDRLTQAPTTNSYTAVMDCD